MTDVPWPLFALRVRTERLVLRVPTDEDLAALALVLPDDVDMNPALPTYDLPLAERRAISLLQQVWGALGNWRPEQWRLCLAAWLDDEPVGMQDVKTTNFPLTRVVATSSWLVESRRGSGIGKEMRGAVLDLAFTGLGAEWAETDAVHDNAASLGVSRSLGYQPNGERIEVHGGVPHRMVALRLSRAAWLAARKDKDAAKISGLEGSLPLFGLT